MTDSSHNAGGVGGGQTVPAEGAGAAGGRVPQPDKHFQGK
jgi:hypothetical protein